MKTLVSTAGYIVYSADSFSFGPWEAADTLNGVTVHKWKAEDTNGNLLSYMIDENRAAIDGSAEPAYQIVEIESYPEDYVYGKYLYIDGAFVENPEWVEPEPTAEERIAELEAQNAEMLEYQLLQDEMILTNDYNILLLQEGM